MAATVPMVGRATERDAVSAAYASAVAGHSQVLLITGEAGIGKSRLVEDLVEGVGPPAGQARVLIGESAPLAGAALAYGPFVAALGERAQWLLDDDPSTAAVARHRLFERVVWQLAELTEPGPLVTILEDLHWADESSWELLAFLAVRLRDLPVLLVVTLREEDLNEAARGWLTGLQLRPRVLRLRLSGLAPAEVAELVTGLVPPGGGPDRVDTVVRAADGNPLYALELARTGARWPPPSITEAVLARAALLPRPVRMIIDQVCVNDGGLSHELLAATVPLEEDDLLTAAREAVSRRLLTAVGERYAFGHDLIREVFYSQLLPGERRRLHLRVAEALAGSAEPNHALLATHWQLADRPDRAAPAALLAARQALSARAYPEADRFYTAAVNQALWLPEAGPPLLEEAAQAASWAGHPERAAQHILAALDGAVGAERARLLERLGRYRWEADDPRAAVEATSEALALLEVGPPSALEARLLAALASWRLLLGEGRQARPPAEEAVAMAQLVGAEAEYARGLAILGIIQAQHGELEAGLAALRTSFSLAIAAGNVEGVIRAATNHVHLLYTAGRCAEALDVARTGRQAAQALTAPPPLTRALDYNTLMVLTATGRWSEADGLLDELVGDAPASGTGFLQLMQMELAVGRGERDRAREVAATLKTSADDPHLHAQLHACLAELALHDGDLVTASEEVLAGLAALAGATLPVEEVRLLANGARIGADLAELPEVARPPHMAVGWETAVASFAVRARAITEEHGREQPEVAAFAAMTAAESARKQGTDDRAMWRAVATAWQTLEQPYREAYTRLREATAAIRAGRRDQAVRALAASESLSVQLGSAPMLTLAGGLARKAKLTDMMRQIRASPSAAEAVARFDLTTRECDVLALLVRGDSYRQIARSLAISERTVVGHVSHIFKKLGAHNRTEAAAIGAHLGLTPP
ncbi:MAG TPA: AAA family ATPase [Streptosporangiaceae bacterium]|nr:AAA family ATPase [Streptosporangiaceae bacterium]